MRRINFFKTIFLNLKLRAIKLVVLDFDGVFTDGGLYFGNENQNFRRFDVKDGIGIKLLQKASYEIAIMSGSNSVIIDKRASNLGINIVIKGVANKLKALSDLQTKLKISKKETLFLGDDINDLSVIKNVSLFIVPADAHRSCKKVASFIGKSKGGKGFIREIAEKLLLANREDPYKALITKNEFTK